MDLPLEALVCEQSGLSPLPDYPIAAIAADEDGLDVANDYWLRADPVHLVLQRDSFSLSEPCPLDVTPEHAQIILASFNAHFSQDGLKFSLGDSGAWYVSVAQSPQIKTILPAVAVDKNIAHFMPQGANAKCWVSYLNEVQMLLHGHAANIAREQAGELVINSVWFSGGGALPMPSTMRSNGDVDCLVGGGAFYKGLAKRAGLGYQLMPRALPMIIAQRSAYQHVQMRLGQDGLLEDTFQTLLQGLKANQIKQLVINLACYEKTLVAMINPIDLYKFWRKFKPVSAFLV